MKKLIPALCMLLISAVLMSTATYAWFSINSTVDATGMQVKTHISSDVLVAETNLDSKYLESLTQTRSALIEPVSSIDGETFYYTVNANALGEKSTGDYTLYGENEAISDGGAGKTGYDVNFNTAYGVVAPVTTDNVAYGYVDYNFYLKATNAGDADENLSLTICNLLYKGNPISDTNGGNGKAVRVAVFSKEVSKNTEYTGALDLVSILKLNGAGNFTQDSTGDKAVNGVTALDLVMNQNAGAVIGTNVPAGETKYYKVVLRLWLEGEDTSCNNETYAALNESWTLDLKFELGGHPVDKLGSATITP